MENIESENQNTIPLLGIDAEREDIDNDIYGSATNEGKNEAWISCFSSELQTIITLAFGIIVSRGSWVVIKSTDTALLGHVSAEALAASSISDLVNSIRFIQTLYYAAMCSLCI
mmetsp:Transcript_13289/g.17225  ORF Transcript_13289/g.17225 Transcript_13289/m.17225 type:complete len:114 (+) Transcript_13289:152-493(+)